MTFLKCKGKELFYLTGRENILCSSFLLCLWQSSLVCQKQWVRKGSEREDSVWLFWNFLFYPFFFLLSSSSFFSVARGTT